MTSTHEPSPGRTSGSREPRLSAFFSPIVEYVADAAATRRELEAELSRERARRQRAIILFQRVPRVLVAGAFALVAAVLEPVAWRSITGVWFGYAALVFVLPVLLRRDEPSSLAARALPPMAITADLLVLGAIFALARQLPHPFLLAASLVVWLAAYHFTWQLGVYAAAVATAVFAGLAGTSPAYARDPTEVLASLAMFAIVTTVATLELATFRSRLRQLQMFCRQVAEGDVGLRLPEALSRGRDKIAALALDLDRMRKRLAEQIGLDALTGCLNRRALESRLRGEWRLARRRHGVVGVLAVDLDRFKEINDRHGHQAGDVVLQQFGAILHGVARESDVVARLGGDEFVMVLPDTDAEGTSILAERLRQRVADFAFGSAGVPMRVTVSVGAAIARGEDDIAPADIIAQADRALYASKQGGRNRVSLGG